MGKTSIEWTDPQYQPNPERRAARSADAGRKRRCKVADHNVIALAEVPAIREPWDGGERWPDFTTCDVCSEAFHHDIMEGRPERQFYELLGEGLVVCEHCVPLLGMPEVERG